MMKKLWHVICASLILRLIHLAWTTPRNWAADDNLDEDMMNTYIRDNQIALKDPPSESYVLNEAGEYSGAAAWADIDAANLTLTLVTSGGDVMVSFAGTFYMTVGASTVYLDVEVDGARTAGDDGIIGTYITTAAVGLSFTRLIEGLAADTHVFVLQWDAVANARLAAGSGGTHDVHPQFWAREVS